MSWVGIINEMQRDVSESIYIDIIDYYEFCENKIHEIEELYQEFLSEFNNIIEEFKKDEEEGWKLLCDYDDECELLLEDCIFKKDEIEKKCIQRLIGFQQGILKIRVKPNENNMVRARIIGFTRGVSKTMGSFSIDIYEKMQEVMLEMRDEIILYMKGLISEGDNLLDETTHILPPSIVKTNEKIFNYKDMIKLALDNGYVYKWTNGSHNIYEHSSSQKIVVIPSHSLGLGLSKKIMKQIQTNIA
ncbi:MAG: type II toxin-antitoxin system HicA family toxin [Clostridium sp.]